MGSFLISNKTVILATEGLWTRAVEAGSLSHIQLPIYTKCTLINDYMLLIYLQRGAGARWLNCWCSNRCFLRHLQPVNAGLDTTHACLTGGTWWWAFVRLRNTVAASSWPSTSSRPHSDRAWHHDGGNIACIDYDPVHTEVPDSQLQYSMITCLSDSPRCCSTIAVLQLLKRPADGH